MIIRDALRSTVRGPRSRVEEPGSPRIYGRFDSLRHRLTFAALQGGSKTMAIMTRWDPFRDVARLQDDMARMLEDRRFAAGESVGWTPACDIYEDEEAVTLRFELAGVEPKDVDVRFENGVLTLRGERKLEKEDRRDGYHRIELGYGIFTRSFSLPGTVDAEKIRAESRNGVLVVTLPKRIEARPRSIQVKVS
jgi:HSP20 family protein